MRGIYWGLTDAFVDEVIEIYPSADEAEEALERVLEDEPDWRGFFRVVPLLMYEFNEN